MTGRPRIPITERFWDKVEKTDACWNWTGWKFENGYGSIRNHPGERPINLLAHRVAYELSVGPIPKGKVIDHLCRNRGCVNPTHLEPVTHHENCKRGALGGPVVPANSRKTHCKQGHPLSGENLYLYTYKKGKKRRMCKTCMKSNGKETQRRHRLYYNERRRKPKLYVTDGTNWFRTYKECGVFFGISESVVFDRVQKGTLRRAYPPEHLVKHGAGSG